MTLRDVILAFLERDDEDDLPKRIGFDACDRERVSGELAEHIRKRGWTYSGSRRTWPKGSQ